jgi:hypothetical protein
MTRSRFLESLNSIKKQKRGGGGEDWRWAKGMAPPLRSLATLAEELISIPTTHVR